MASSQPNVWQTQTANRNNRNSISSASRTPQNRSNTASPSQASNNIANNTTSAPSQPPKEPKPNAWAQRSPAIQPTPSNGTLQEEQQQLHIPANNFNVAEIRSYLSRAGGATIPSPYKPVENSGTANTRTTTPWAKAGNMANGQPFWQYLAKQVATFEGGG